MITISQLWCYPVKSCQGIAMNALTMDRFGAVGDRRWMIVDGHGGSITQRQNVKLGQVGVLWDGEILRLSALGMPELRLNGDLMKLCGENVNVSLWGDDVQALHQGDEAAAWLTAFLGVDSMLVAMPESTNRFVDQQFTKDYQTVSFADGFPLLLTSESSLKQFCSWLGRDIEMQRFRPNVVISGAKPWAEDDWHTIEVHDTKYSLVKPCSRCVIPSFNLATGCRESDVTQSLVTYRKGQDGQVYFGHNMLYSLSNEDSPILQKGDQIFLTETTCL